MSCKPAQQLTKGVPLPSTWTGHALGDFEHQHVLLKVLPSGLFFLLFSLSTSESSLGSITACVSDVSTGPRTTGNASDGSLRRNVYANRKSSAYRWYCGLSSDQINIWITCSLHEHEDLPKHELNTLGNTTRFLQLDPHSFPTNEPVSYTHLTLPTKRIV